MVRISEQNPIKIPLVLITMVIVAPVQASLESEWIGEDTLTELARLNFAKREDLNLS